MSHSKTILIVVTSHPAIDENHSTGLWFEEFAAPFTLFKKQGYSVSVASPQGGGTPIDPRSLEHCKDNEENQAARMALKKTHRLDSSFKAADFNALFFPGGHGTMFDLPDNSEVQRLVREFIESDKVLAAVCHGPASLVGAQLSDGSPVVQGRKLTSFTNQEEQAVELDQHMPFLLESKLRELGAKFVAAENWQDNVVVDGNLVTGQNPQSSASVAREIIRRLAP